jgi:cell division septal protein FtsQ
LPKGYNAALLKSRKVLATFTWIALLFGALTYLLAWSSIFSVTTVSVAGAPNIQAEKAVLTIADIATGEKIARVEPRATALRIESIDWIASAAVSRSWVSGDVLISIKPRRPSALFNGQTIDRSGAIFSLPGFVPQALPRISALSTAAGLQALELYRAVPTTFQDQITSLTAFNESNFGISLKYGERDIRIKWGRNEESALKVEVISALLNLPENKKIRRIDVSAPHAPIVK